MEEMDSTHFESFLRLQFPKFSKGYKPSDFDEFIDEHIGRDYVLSLSRLAFPNEWQIQISDNDIREKLIRMRKTKINNRSCWIFPLGSSEIRGFIHWLPNTVSNTIVEEFLRNYGRVLFVKNENREMHGMKTESGSKYFGLVLKSEYSKESVPHFSEFDGFTGLINIWGRVSPCFFCKDFGHRKTQCVKFKQKLKDYSGRPQTHDSSRRKRPRGLRYAVLNPPKYKDFTIAANDVEPNYKSIYSQITSLRLREHFPMLSMDDEFQIQTEPYFDLKVFKEFLEQLKYTLTDEANIFHTCVKRTLLETVSKVGMYETLDVLETQETNSDTFSTTEEQPERTNETVKNIMKLFFSTLKNKLELIEIDYNLLRAKVITLCEQFEAKYEKMETSDEMDYLPESLQSKFLGDFPQLIRDRVAASKNQMLHNITSMAVAGKLSEEKFISTLSQIRRTYEQIIKRISEMCPETTYTSVHAESVGRDEAKAVGSHTISSGEVSIFSEDFPLRVLERIATSENIILKNYASKLFAGQLNEEEFICEISEIWNNYDKLRENVSGVLFLKTTKTPTGASAEEIKSSKVQESSNPSKELQRKIKERIATSESRSMEQITSMAVAGKLSDEKLISRLSQTRCNYEKIRKRISEVICPETTYIATRSESERSEVERAGDEVVRCLTESVEGSILNDDFILRVLERIASSEDIMLKNSVSELLEGQLNATEFVSKIWKIWNYNDKLRENVSGTLFLKIAEAEIGTELVKGATDVIAEEIESVTIAIQRSNPSEELKRRIIERIEISKHQALQKITSMAAAEKLSEKFISSLLQIRNKYDEIRQRISKVMCLETIYIPTLTKTAETTELRRARSEVVRNLIASVEENPTFGDFPQRVLERIASSEDLMLKNYISNLFAGQLNEEEFICKISEIWNNYDKLRKSVSGVLFLKTTESATGARAVEIKSPKVAVQESSNLSKELQRKIKERIATSEKRTTKQIMSMAVAGKLSEEKLISRLSQIWNSYEDIKKGISEVMDLDTTSMYAESVEASEFVRAVAEDIESCIISLQKSSIYIDDLMQRIMGRIAISENRNLDKCMAQFDKTKVLTKISIFTNIYETLRKRIIDKILEITQSVSRVKSIDRAKVAAVVAEEIGSLIVSLKECSIFSNELTLDIMDQIATYETENLEKLKSMAAEAQIDEAELMSRTSLLHTIFKELKKTVEEVLPQETLIGICPESVEEAEVVRTVAEEIGSLRVSLQDGSILSNTIQRRITERIAISENQFLEEIVRMAFPAQTNNAKIISKILLLRSSYEELRKKISEIPLLKTNDWGSSGERVERDQISESFNDAFDKLMIFLEGDFTQVVMELTSGNQNLELSARKSRWSNDHELKRVIEKLCLMAAEMDTSADEFKTAVKEIDSLRLLKKSSISNPGFMKGIMNLINISENQSLEKITSMEVAVHLSGEQLNLKIKQLKRNFEKVRKIVSVKLLEKGIRTGSYAEIVPEEDENLRAPLQKSLVSSNSFVDDIFKRIDSAEKQTVDKITSSEVAAQLSGTELTKKLSQSLNSYKVLRHRFEKTVANIDKIV